MEQITLNFDASEFDGYETAQEFFAHMTCTVKDDAGRIVKQGVQAMELDYSPSQWSHKRTKSNNTAISLEDADKHTEIYGDVSWIYYLIQKHIIKKKRNREQLLRLKAEIERQLGEK